MMTFDCVVQVILVVNQIYWCQEVEAAFKKLSSNKNAMADYNNCLLYTSPSPRD